MNSCLTKMSNGKWRFEIVTSNVEPYLEMALERNWDSSIANLLSWDLIWEFEASLRRKFYTRAIIDSLIPKKEQLVKCLRKERKSCLDSLISHIIELAVDEPDRYPKYVKWLTLFRSAMKVLTKKELSRIWWVFSDNPRKRKYLAYIMPLSFFPIIMSEEKVDENWSWKAVFEKRLILNTE